MAQVNLPEGYTLESPVFKKMVDKKEFDIKYTILRKDGKIVLALPTEHCPPQRIEEVIKQTKES